MPFHGKRFQGLVSSDDTAASTGSGIKPSKQATALVEKTTSLSAIEFMFCRAVKDGGETAMSLESQDLEYLLKINEYLDIQAYLEKDMQKQAEAKHKK